MEVMIGREAQSRRLSVTRDGKVQLVGKPGSVPMDVSKSHVALCTSGDGTWEVRNLKEANVTYVNGLPIEKKTVHEGDSIELGMSHFKLSWDVIRGPKQEVADIRHLRHVWNEYKEDMNEIDERQKNTSVLASVPMMFTMGSTMLGGLFRMPFMQNAIGKGTGDIISNVCWALAGVAFIMMIYSIFRRKNDTSKQDKEALNKSMYKKYVCPKCGKFLGMQDYDLLIQQHDQCGFCKAKFIK